MTPLIWALTASVSSGVNSNGSLAECSASSTMASITGLDGGVTEHHALEHFVFAQLLDFGFDHHHRVAGGGDDEIHLGLLHLVQRGIEDVFAVDHADADAADRAHEGRAGQDEGRGGRDQGDDVGIVLEVMGEDGADHLNLVLEALDEQRPDRTVDQARGQGLFLRRGAFPAREAAGDLAGGVEFFLVVHGQGEEVLTGLGRFGVDGGGEDHGLAVGGEDRAVGLARDAAGFEGQLAAAPFEGFTSDVEHVGCFSFLDICVARASSPPFPPRRQDCHVTVSTDSRAGCPRHGVGARLAAKAQRADEGRVAGLVGGLEVVEKRPALRNHVEQRPRREWWSFLWVLKCSVRLAIRSERIATWTSAEPVSPSDRA